jgi:hypothetical protein
MFGIRIPTLSQVFGGGGSNKKQSSPAPAPAPAPAAAPPPPPPPSRRFSYDEPASFDFSDPLNPKKVGNKRSILAGETGGYNPATGQQALGGMRSLLG